MEERAFVDRVRSALGERVGAILAEPLAGPGKERLQHRELAERIKALVAAGEPGPAESLAARLHELQGPSGLFRGGDNVDSPPDSAFSVNDLADAVLMLRDANAGQLAASLQDILAAATPALLRGGVHTPNHRWELAAALARLHRLDPRPELAARAEQWLAEGVDIDEDGLYSERSANYAAHVSNPSLLAIAGILGRPDLVDAVERNLTATLDLLLPDGSVETVHSRRQDQRWPVPLSAFLLPLRRVAQLRGRGDLAWAAGRALEQGIDAPADAAVALRLDPAIARPLPSAEEPVRPRRRHFASAGLVVDHGRAATTVVFGGSDYGRHGRIRSGLANSPTFLRMFAGAVVLDSARLSRTFFGLGPFRAQRMVVEHDAVTLTETVSAAYYQPLAPEGRDAGGRYRLADEGRFSAAMDFDRRDRDTVTLTTTIRIGLTPTGVDLTIDIAGPEVEWALELAFRPGGTMTGARALGASRVNAAWTARYRVGDDALAVTVPRALGTVALGTVAPGTVAPETVAPSYHAGEDYAFLGGTDAAIGERLYLAGRAPARVTVELRTGT